MQNDDMHTFYPVNITKTTLIYVNKLGWGIWRHWTDVETRNARRIL